MSVAFKIRAGAIAVTAMALTVSTAAYPAQAHTNTDRTGAAHAELVDRLSTPILDWSACMEGALCATVKLPMDYQKPAGAKIEVALTKVAASGPQRKIGTLFVNPGGPGGSGTEMAVRSMDLLSPALLERFDIVGFDPRGTNSSTRLQCFETEVVQSAAISPFLMGFPVTKAEEGTYRRAADNLAQRCSQQKLAKHMSTTDVARDMEMLRRAVGDKKLTYLGWSYGTYLGQVYAAMFPDRVRALALDGVIDAEAWRGDRSRTTPVTMRLNTAVAAHEALIEVLDRCAAAPSYCPLVDPQGQFEAVAESLRQQPLTITDEDGDEYDITYADLITELLYTLYDPVAAADVPFVISVVEQMLTENSSTRAHRRAATTYNRLHKNTQERIADTQPMANDFELAAAVLCSDSRNPPTSRRWPQLAQTADDLAPYFGRQALWGSAVCGQWRAFDEDAFAGTFNARTAAPVLVVGNRWDPATPYAAAVSVANRLPNSKLISSDNWGHTAYGNSDCVDQLVDAYLLDVTVPISDAECTDGFQPFES